jgi:hypothetical protein
VREKKSCVFGVPWERKFVGVVQVNGGPAAAGAAAGGVVVVVVVDWSGEVVVPVEGTVVVGEVGWVVVELEGAVVVVVVGSDVGAVVVVVVGVGAIVVVGPVPGEEEVELGGPEAAATVLTVIPARKSPVAVALSANDGRNGSRRRCPPARSDRRPSFLPTVNGKLQCRAL